MKRTSSLYWRQGVNPLTASAIAAVMTLTAAALSVGGAEAATSYNINYTGGCTGSGSFLADGSVVSNYTTSALSCDYISFSGPFSGSSSLSFISPSTLTGSPDPALISGSFLDKLEHGLNGTWRIYTCTLGGVCGDTLERGNYTISAVVPPSPPLSLF